MVTLSIKDGDFKEEVDFHKVYENIEFVKLETTKECLVGEIANVKVTEDRIYVLDKKLAKSLFVFTRKGKYLFKLSGTGHGPGEFIYPADFWINELSGEIMILSGVNSKLLYYDYEGIVHKEIMLRTSSRNISSQGKDTVFVYTCSSNASIRNQIIQFNRKGKVINSYLPYKSTNKQYPVCHTLSHTNFYQTGNKAELLFTLPFEDYIYSMSSGSIMPKYLIDFNNTKMPADYFKGAKTDNILELFKELPYAYGVHNVFENDSLLTFNYYLQGRRQVFYYKKTGRLLQCRTVIPSVATTFENFGFYNNYLIGQIEPTILLSRIDKHPEQFQAVDRNDQKNKTVNALLSLAKEVNENNNPIITFIKLKY